MTGQEKDRQEEAMEDIEETAGQAVPTEEEAAGQTAEEAGKETAETSACSRGDFCGPDSGDGQADVFDDGPGDLGEPEEEEAGQDAEEGKTGKRSRAERRAEKKASKKAEDAYLEKIAALEDQVRRQMAEFDNFRKRTDKEKAAMFETGAKSVIEKILPVVDNFERGLASVTEEDKETPFAEGMNLIYKQLMTELDAIGVKPIEAVGEEFDPDFHNAVMQVENEEYESGTVAQELLKGYTYRDSVVRHSMVAVTQ